MDDTTTCQPFLRNLYIDEVSLAVEDSATDFRLRYGLFQRTIELMKFSLCFGNRHNCSVKPFCDFSKLHDIPKII